MKRWLPSVALANCERQETCAKDVMNWNNEQIPVPIAMQIGWNLPLEFVGAGVYGGIVKRSQAGKIIIGDEWPENNRCPPALNPVHSRGPFLDFSKFTFDNFGYTHIARLLQIGDVHALAQLFKSLDNEADAKPLANLVMTGGARPLHMCGMSRGGDASKLIGVLISYGADVNSKDNYEYTPLDRLGSNSAVGSQILIAHGAIYGVELPRDTPRWDSEDLAYVGPGESQRQSARARFDSISRFCKFWYFLFCPCWSREDTKTTKTTKTQFLKTFKHVDVFENIAER